MDSSRSQHRITGNYVCGLTYGIMRTYFCINYTVLAGVACMSVIVFMPHFSGWYRSLWSWRGSQSTEHRSCTPLTGRYTAL